jgi:hypothetical protein
MRSACAALRAFTAETNVKDILIVFCVSSKTELPFGQNSAQNAIIRKVCGV